MTKSDIHNLDSYVITLILMPTLLLHNSAENYITLAQVRTVWRQVSSLGLKPRLYSGLFLLFRMISLAHTKLSIQQPNEHHLLP